MHGCFRLACCLLLSLSLAGCDATSSDDLETGQIRFHGTVSADGGGNARVEVELYRGASLHDYVRLGRGDRLTVTVADVTRLLRREESSLGAISYRAELPHLPGARYSIALSRSDGRDAPESSAVMPREFRIESPRPGDVFREGDVVELAWSPAEVQTMRYGFSADCRRSDDSRATASGFFGAETRAGRHRIAATDLIPAPRYDDAGNLIPVRNCEIELTFVHAQGGYVDRAFRSGGRIDAQQERTRVIEFQSDG